MAINAISSNSQPAWQQLQFQQVQRSADQAAQSARSLQAQANSAQAAADSAQAKANSLQSKASQAQFVAGQTNILLQTTKSLGQIGTQINDALDQVVKRQTTAQPAAPAQAPKVVVNTQGQTIGTVVNTTA